MRASVEKEKDGRNLGKKKTSGIPAVWSQWKSEASGIAPSDQRTFPVAFYRCRLIKHTTSGFQGVLSVGGKLARG